MRRWPSFSLVSKETKWRSPFKNRPRFRGKKHINQILFQLIIFYLARWLLNWRSCQIFSVTELFNVQSCVLSLLMTVYLCEIRNSVEFPQLISEFLDKQSSREDFFLRREHARSLVGSSRRRNIQRGLSRPRAPPVAFSQRHIAHPSTFTDVFLTPSTRWESSVCTFSILDSKMTAENIYSLQCHDESLQFPNEIISRNLNKKMFNSSIDLTRSSSVEVIHRWFQRWIRKSSRNLQLTSCSSQTQTRCWGHSENNMNEKVRN